MNTEATSTDTASYCLAWAIRQSFVSYIQNAPDGTIWVGSGVNFNEAGEFLFPLNHLHHTPRDRRLLVSFSGEVAFTAHGGALNVLIADPWIEAGGVLSVRTSPSLTVGESIRSPLARLSNSNQVDSFNCQLTDEGVHLFGGTYPSGSDLAPVGVFLPTTLRTLLDQ